MEKKLSPKNKKEADLASAPPPGISSRVFGIIKFILGVCLLPFVYSSTVVFLNEFTAIEKPLQNYFWSGAVTFLIIYLFIWEPAAIYAKGQRLVEIIFAFFKPLVRVAPYLLPVYTIVLFVLYWIISYSIKGAQNYFIFLLGFTTVMHLVFSAKTIRGKQQDFLKANYIFGFSCVYIITLLLVAFCLSFLFAKFSFVNFANSSFQLAKNIFGAVFKQLFLR